jgi:hypothetical protein
MALTQMQLIQSLGDALAWFERELNWGVPPTELRHLCGRIGELYVALITNGQMATEVNQRGYDVVSKEGERISVKTTATSGGGFHVAFTASSLELVDRVVVLRVNTEEMQIESMLDESLANVLPLLKSEVDGKRTLYVGQKKEVTPRAELKAIRTVTFRDYTFRELENGSIEVEKGGVAVSPVKPELRTIALLLNVSLVNSSGNPLNTRQLGTQVIKSVEALSAHSSLIHRE